MHTASWTTDTSDLISLALGNKLDRYFFSIQCTFLDEYEIMAPGL